MRNDEVFQELVSHVQIYLDKQSLSPPPSLPMTAAHPELWIVTAVTWQLCTVYLPLC